MVSQEGRRLLRLIAIIYARTGHKPRTISHVDVVNEQINQRRAWKAWHKEKK